MIKFLKRFTNSKLEVDKFLREHSECFTNYVNVITITNIQTGIGVKTTLSCSCKECEDITNYDMW